MAPASSKRVKGVKLVRQFTIGNTAHILPHPAFPDPPPEGHTKGWTVYIRPLPNGPDIRTWLKKVQFKLHHTYNDASRTIEASTLDVEKLKNGGGFEVSETGYGEFNVEIRLYFAPESGEKAQYREHYLILGSYGTDEEKAKQEKDNNIVAERLEIVEFNEPTQDFFALMTGEEQFDWLKVKKGRGKGKKPDFVFEGDVAPTAQLPERPPDGTENQPGKGGVWSKTYEKQTLAHLKQSEKILDDTIKDETRQADERRKRLIAV